jgi:hypothetical protein
VDGAAQALLDGDFSGDDSGDGNRTETLASLRDLHLAFSQPTATPVRRRVRM